jgi:hypothetical protein
MLKSHAGIPQPLAACANIFPFGKPIDPMCMPVLPYWPCWPIPQPTPADLLQRQIADLDRQIYSLSSLRASLCQRLTEYLSRPPMVLPMPAILCRSGAHPNLADVLRSIQ